MTERDDGGPGRAGRGQPSSDYTGHSGGPNLAQTLSDLARSLQDEENLDDTLDRIVTAAVGTVPGSEHAGITVVEARRKVYTRAATDELVRKVDQVQYETAQGPCLDAAYEQRTVRLSDMTSDDRWPGFTEGALFLGVQSMLSFQLYVVRDNLGALNLYSAETDAFDDESETVGLLFAAHAAVAMAGARREEHMARAMSMRDVIGQAKGILMERHRLSADQAFALLVRASQRTNTKLTEIARILTETGELPRS
jgi:transcriptional regulator with GAF, ATPase, and Fis domain